jgi:tetratricopeptide (TPR) repeat protein
MRYVCTLSLVALIGLFPAGLFGQVPGTETPAAQPEPQGPNYLSMGNAAFEQGNYAEALELYLRVPGIEATPYAVNRLGLSYHMLNRLSEAESVYKNATRGNKELSAAYNNLGALYYGRRKFKDAENRFKDALKYDAQNRVLRQNLRAAKYARENGKQIRPVLLELMSENPLLVLEREGDVVKVVMLMSPEVLVEVTLQGKKGDSFLARKMFEDAIIEYQRAIKIDRYDPSIINRLGIAYHQSQRLKDAEKQYKAALKINPYYLEALNNLGSIEYTRKRFRRAMDYYGKALDIRPNSPTILQNIGSCLFAMERFEQGLQIYIRALQLDPDLFNHVGGFGTLIQTSQRNESMVNFYMAKVFANSGDKDRTMSYLYKAVEEGFKNDEMLRGDPAFSLLADDERFIQLLASFG